MLSPVLPPSPKTRTAWARGLPGGLAARGRSQSIGYRRYGRGDEERLRFVRGVRRLGFALGEIREVLALRDPGEPPCAYVAELIEQRASDVDEQIAELERLKGELAELRDRAVRLPHPRGPRSVSPSGALPIWSR